MDEDIRSICDRLKLLETITAKSPGNLYWKDLNGVYLGCNNSQAKILGFSSGKEIIGKTDFELPWSKEAATLRANDLEVIEKNKAFLKEEIVTLPDGSTAIYYSKKEPLHDDEGNVIGLLGTSLDITELKKAEHREKIALTEATTAQAKAQAEEELKRTILTFAGTMSHDLRTPLGTVLMSASVLQKCLPTLIQTYQEAKAAGAEVPAINPRQLSVLQELTNNIIQAGKQSNAYIDTTLKMVRGVAAGADLIQPDDLVPCSMEHCIRRVIQYYPYQNDEESKIHLNTEYDFEYLGNELFMSRIIENLIKNAFEQIALKGQGEIFITTGCNDFNYIKIKDTAGGVTPVIADKLFQGMQSSKQGGTGLGLSSAQQIMQAFGGNIRCQVVDGDCIEFCLSFP